MPATLGITVLTSMSPEALAATGVARPLPEQVAALAAQAKEAGISGVVASPQEAAALREILGPDAFIVTPGVRRPAPPGRPEPRGHARPGLRERSVAHRGGPAHHRGGRSRGGLRGHRRGTGVAPKRFIPE